MYKGGSSHKNWCVAKVLGFLIRYFSNYYTLHRSDLAARAAPLDPRLMYCMWICKMWDQWKLLYIKSCGTWLGFGITRKETIRIRLEKLFRKELWYQNHIVYKYCFAEWKFLMQEVGSVKVIVYKYCFIE